MASSKKKGGAADGGAAEDGATPPKKSMKMKIIIAVLVLLVGGGAAKFTILKPAAKASADTKKTAAKPVPGPTVEMDELTLNLADGHFLRLKLSVITTKGTSATLELTEGIQAAIDEYSNKPMASLTGTKARTKAKNQLLKAFQKLYPKKILDLVYTEFVMQ